MRMEGGKTFVQGCIFLLPSIFNNSSTEEQLQKGLGLPKYDTTAMQEI